MPCAFIRSLDMAMKNATVHSPKYERITGPFRTWIASSTTFGELKVSAAAFWGVNAKDVVLQDGEGCNWPESASVARLMSQDHHRGKSNIVLLDRRDAALDMVREEAKNGESRSTVDPDGVRTKILFGLSPSSSSCVENSLWRIFTWYCANGDPFDLASLHKRHFVAFLKHCRLISSSRSHACRSSLTQAQANVLYTRMATRGRAVATSSKRGKLGFEEFINALRRVAASSSRTEREDNDDDVFGVFLERRVFPNAKRWDEQKWARCRRHLRDASVLHVFQRFAPSLSEIFCFYSSSSSPSLRSGDISTTISYKTFLDFCHDFDLATMHAGTRKEFADAFLASCDSNGLPFVQGEEQDRVVLLECDVDSETNQDDDGLWHPRRHLNFGRFLEAIGRFALVTFSDVYPQKPPCDLVKAMLQQMGRSLRHSRVLKIINTRRSVSTYPALLMRGTRSFQAELLRLWREDDGRDYMTSRLARETESDDVVRLLREGFVSPTKQQQIARSHLELLHRKTRRRKNDSHDEIVGTSHILSEVHISTSPKTSPSFSLNATTSVTDASSPRASNSRVSTSTSPVSRHGGAESSIRSEKSQSRLDRSAIKTSQSFENTTHVPDSNATTSSSAHRLNMSPSRAVDVDTARESVKDGNGADSSLPGMSTQDIISLQLFLSSVGPSLEISGTFDAQTVHGLKRYLGTTYDRSTSDRVRGEEDMSNDTKLNANTIRTLQKYLNTKLSIIAANSSQTDRTDLFVSEDGKWSEHLSHLLRTYTAPSSSSAWSVENDMTHEFGREEANLNRRRRSDLSDGSGDWEKLLCAGALFVKHGRRGKPKVRFVWLDRHPNAGDRDRIRWCEESQRRAKSSAGSKRAFLVSDILSVHGGVSSGNFGRSNNELSSEKCFSITVRHRSFDLEADSEETCVAWIKALRVLLRSKHIGII